MCYVLHPAVSTAPLIHSTVKGGTKGETLGARLQKNVWVYDGDMSKDEKVRKEQMGERTIIKFRKLKEKGQREETDKRQTQTMRKR